MRNRKGKRRKTTNPKTASRRRREGWHVLDVDVRTRRRKRKRKRMSLGTQKMISAGLIVLGLIVSFVVTRAALSQFLFNDPEYTLRWIDYETDGLLTKEKVMDAAGIESGGNLLKIDLSDMRQSLLAMAEIREVQIGRDLPDRLAVSIKERRPVAWISCRAMDVVPKTASRRDQGIRGLMVDREGVLLECRTLEPRYVKLPVIHVRELSEDRPGHEVEPEQVRKALDLVRICGEHLFADSLEVEDVVLQNEYSLLARFNSEAKVTFGLENLEQKVADFRLINASSRQKNRRIDTVNLLVNRNIPVTYIKETPREAEPAPVKRAPLRALPTKPRTLKRRVPKDEIMKSELGNILGTG